MVQLSFTKSFENCSQLSDKQILTVASVIAENALACQNIQEYLKKHDKHPDKVFIVFCDVDRIYLTLNPDATPEMNEDFIIRTWNYGISGQNPKALSVEWTFFCMGETGGEEYCDGNDDIVIFD